MHFYPGWTGKILKINLTDKSIGIINPDASIYKSFIGGRGLAGYYLRPYCTHPWNSPEMPVLFFTGPLTATDSPSCGRVAVMSVSPLTGTVFCSTAGSNFGTELKRAGWDGIIVTGKSGTPCGIKISDKKIDVIDAQSLRGLTVPGILSSLPIQGSTAITGPAAENGVLYSGIAFDGDPSEMRGGLGLVMYSKGLKYIHVRGTSDVPVYDSEMLASAREDIMRLVSASPALMGELGISEFGTGAFYDLIQSRRMLPTRNFRETYFPDEEKVNAWHFRQKFDFNKSGCAGCDILCMPESGSGNMIPGFEAMAHFSALIGNSDIDLVMKASDLCSNTGMDPISAASSIACYMEIKGLSVADIDLTEMLDDIAYSHGDGEILKLGAGQCAEILGVPSASMSVKGLELPPYDPRGAYGMALSYSVSTCGGSHATAYPVSHEILRKPVATDRFTFSGKAGIVKTSEDINSCIDSLTSCRYIFIAASMEEYSRIFHAVTGINMSGYDLVHAGERIYYNERLMNFMRGFTAVQDDLPGRFFTEEGSSGDSIDIPPVPRDAFLDAREKYFKIRGLSPEGAPLKEKCLELGLEWIA